MQSSGQGRLFQPTGLFALPNRQHPIVARPELGDPSRNAAVRRYNVHRQEERESSIQDSPTYGYEFIERYQAAARSTPFEYATLQKIRAMDRLELSEELTEHSELLAEIVLHVPAARAAELYHKDQVAQMERAMQASRWRMIHDLSLVLVVVVAIGVFSMAL